MLDIKIYPEDFATLERPIDKNKLINGLTTMGIFFSAWEVAFMVGGISYSMKEYKVSKMVETTKEIVKFEEPCCFTHNIGEKLKHIKRRH